MEIRQIKQWARAGPAGELSLRGLPPDPFLFHAPMPPHLFHLCAGEILGGQQVSCRISVCIAVSDRPGV